MGKRGIYEIRFVRRNHGKNGGNGPPRSFLATLSEGTLKEAAKKLRCDGEIIGVSKPK